MTRYTCHVAGTKWLRKSWYIVNKQCRVYVKVPGATDERAGIRQSQPTQPLCRQPADLVSGRYWLACAQKWMQEPTGVVALTRQGIRGRSTSVIQEVHFDRDSELNRTFLQAVGIGQHTEPDSTSPMDKMLGPESQVQLMACTLQQSETWDGFGPDGH